MRTFPEYGPSLAKGDGRPPVEDVERAFPVTFVAEGFPITDNSSVKLIHIGKSAVLHDDRQHLATDSTGAVGDHGAVLQVVVFAALDFGDEAGSRIDVGHDGIPEASDLGFVGVASIEKDDIVARLHELVDLVRGEMNASTDHSALIDLYFVGDTESDDLRSFSNLKTRKVVAGALGPLEVGVLEQRIFAGTPNVQLHCVHRTANGSVDAVVRHDDPTLQAE